MLVTPFRVSASRPRVNALGRTAARSALAPPQGIDRGIRPHMWFNIAASRGEENVQKLRDIVVDIMTPDQLAEAQRLAREWKPKKE